MAKKTLKVGLLVAVCGSMLGWGGCLGGGDSWWGVIAQDLAMDAAWEFLYDNDAVYDLFDDDFGTGAQYDDRNSLTPGRVEP
ncbi:MAG: hypothetical protein KAV82_06360 [Phycisphaerae bacterium]|nr:hypothetical protein [Phycisphaerae bacterium]